MSLLKLERPLQMPLLETLGAMDQALLDAMPLGETRLEFLPEGVCCWITLSRSDPIESDFAATTAAGPDDVPNISDRAITSEIESSFQVTSRY